MGRARKFDRDEAIDWVMNEIWRVGFEACSVKAISERLGITRSSFYNSFGSREALFLEAFERYSKASAHSNLTNVVKTSSPLNLLNQLFREVCEERVSDQEHRGCMMVNSMSELIGVHPELGPIIANFTNNSIRLFEVLLKQSIDQGELPEDTDVHSLALVIQSLLIGINTLSKVVHKKEELLLTVNTTLKALGLFKD
jgi:TetR/AcrR family transcriptional repressor of nem operon